ncbi:MAG: succinate-semialdehyde dehydrogenase/glutarate-semialdehyde dehydrogenase [Psychromonas sp.]|jgi:succinate-semialdehyde dehydrogenase/glutarate-semialdehyde dehydrogenase|uniref:aldehyde dehydrogenase family protein n=1 Tax=Psychromonas sp. TaxID=1884585 RepID=UPI0039E2CF47
MNHKQNQKMYIFGKLTENKCKANVFNPATDEIITEISVANIEVAQQALEGAQKATQTWGKTTVLERITWMHKLRDECVKNQETLRELVHQETGKTWAHTEDDYTLLIDSLTFYAEEISRFQPSQLIDSDEGFQHTLKYKPVGVVVAYLAWNFPLLNLAYKLGPAMATGCPIIIKPSIQSPLSAYFVGALCEKIGLPAGAVTILAGEDRTVSNYLSSSTIPSMLTLIGSIQTGVKIMQAGSTSIKRYSMELGGNTPYIINADADLDLAVNILTSLKSANAGQICVSPNRIFVHKSIKQAFIDKVLTVQSGLKLGFGKNTDANMGPLIDKGSRDRIHGLVTDAISKGANLLCGGEFNDQEKGAFYPLTMIDDVTTAMDIYNHEIFGPVISVVYFDESDDVIALANDTDTGLASYVFSQNAGLAQQQADALDFGEVQVNGVKYGIHLPHLGIKQSGIGCDCSKYALNDYLSLIRKSVKK